MIRSVIIVDLVSLSTAQQYRIHGYCIWSSNGCNSIFGDRSVVTEMIYHLDFNWVPSQNLQGNHCIVNSGTIRCSQARVGQWRTRDFLHDELTTPVKCVT